MPVLMLTANHLKLAYIPYLFKCFSPALVVSQSFRGETRALEPEGVLLKEDLFLLDSDFLTAIIKISFRNQPSRLQ